MLPCDSQPACYSVSDVSQCLFLRVSFRHTTGQGRHDDRISPFFGWYQNHMILYHRYTPVVKTRPAPLPARQAKMVGSQPTCCR
jgi:hypothetical protein